jgi:rod shape-determining protein MreC
MLLVVVLFAQLLVMAYQLRHKQDVPLVRGAVVYVVAPIQRSLAFVVQSVRNTWEGYLYLWGTRRQNEALTAEMDILKLENQRLRTQAEQGRRLQVLFDIREQLPLPTIAAQVLSAGSAETARIILIDKGTDSGLKTDLPVLVADGVVGKVLHVFDNTAQVLLITDPYSGVAALVEGSRVHGVVKGTNRRICVMEYVQNDEEVRKGELIYTSGEDQIFPKGLPIGVIADTASGLEFQQITVEPLARLNQLEEVLVILEAGGDVGEFPVRKTAKEDEEVEPPSTEALEPTEPATTVTQSTGAATSPDEGSRQEVAVPQQSAPMSAGPPPREVATPTQPMPEPATDESTELAAPTPTQQAPDSAPLPPSSSPSTEQSPGDPPPFNAPD